MALRDDCGAGGLCSAAQAQDWPSRPVTMVVAAAAGGPIDVLGRIMAERMSPSLGQRVLVENAGGSGGIVGGQRVAKAKPNGYTMLLGTIATHANPQLHTDKPPYDPVSRFRADGADRGNPAGAGRAQESARRHAGRVRRLRQEESSRHEFRLGRRGIGLASRLRHAPARHRA